MADASGNIVTGKRTRKPRRVLRMHMGSSRCYGYDSEEERQNAEREQQKKQLSQVKAEKKRLKDAERKRQKELTFKHQQSIKAEEKSKSRDTSKKISSGRSHSNSDEDTGIIACRDKGDEEVCAIAADLGRNGFRESTGKGSTSNTKKPITKLKRKRSSSGSGVGEMKQKMLSGPRKNTFGGKEIKRKRTEVLPSRSFAIQTVVGLIPASSSAPVCNPGTEWLCGKCGDVNRSDQQVCSMCFAASSGVSLKDVPKAVDPKSWNDSDFFLQWWRRGLISAVQQRMSLPTISSVRPGKSNKRNVGGGDRTVARNVSTTSWVQCNLCLKWRRLLGSPVDLPKVWSCCMNKEADPSHACCDAPEEVDDEMDCAADHGSKDVKQYTKDHDTLVFLEKLRNFYQATGKSIKFRSLTLGGRELNLYRLYNLVLSRGGHKQVMAEKGSWAKIFRALENYSKTETSASFRLKNIYKKYLLDFEIYERRSAELQHLPSPSELSAPLTILPFPTD